MNTTFMKKLICFLFLLVTFNISKGQEEVYTTNNKKAIKHFKEAIKFYEGRNDQKAMEELNLCIELAPEFIEPHYFLAQIFREKMQLQKAIDEFKKGLAINPNYMIKTYFMLSELEYATGKYQDAKTHMEKVNGMQWMTPDMQETSDRIIAGCEFALVAMKEPVPFEPVNMGKNINSAVDEYFPALTIDDEMILFTRNNADKTDGHIQEDFYISIKRDGIWYPAENIGPPVNTPGNEGAPNISPDRQMLLFVACENFGNYGPGRRGYGSCDIFFTTLNGRKWGQSNNIGAPVNSSDWETQPSFSSDGRTLYFISKRKGGYGSGDIWMSVFQDNGKWSAPQNLGKTINTPGDEESPFIHPDGHTLYFASNGHVGMGGTDIYYSKKDSTGNWGKPVNLGYPINTHKDENSLVVSATGDLAYMSSEREGGFGGLDLYCFKLYESARPTPVTYMKGKVFDRDSKKPLEAIFQLIDLETGKVIVESYSNKGDGSFLISLPINKDYALNASLPGYLFFSENFSLKNLQNNTPYKYDVPMIPIKEGETIELKNVFFKTASYELDKRSEIELNKLVIFMKNNSTLKAELRGHTDDIGDDKSNLLLSENRAKSVYNYLVSNGIEKERLSYKGFGELQPKAPNINDNNRAQNRRTEFFITSK